MRSLQFVFLAFQAVTFALAEITYGKSFPEDVRCHFHENHIKVNDVTFTALRSSFEKLKLVDSSFRR